MMDISNYLDSNPPNAGQINALIARAGPLGQSHFQVSDRAGHFHSRMLHGKRTALRAIANSIRHAQSLPDAIRKHKRLQRILLSRNPGSATAMTDAQLSQLSLEQLKALNQSLITTLAAGSGSAFGNPGGNTESTGSAGGARVTSQLSGSAAPSTLVGTVKNAQAAAPGTPVAPSCNPNSSRTVPSQLVCSASTVVGAGKGWDTDVNYESAPASSTLTDQSLITQCNFTLKPYISCVKDQAYRGTCTAFSTIGALRNLPSL